ncbi:hypothetical protein G7Z17_g2006 [Cylindrodendrum hubeiense]|uniref:D-xylose 1-dehydrogenase (NADP(+), D-xylono-1,5-lactone-forming) n=1 Tax=Cylindrodendrum hubeiense TaxID=595255 RepID=A0A9P5HJR4_9HYPO|nr:hypothetical protein G7Z17_g2006 [Cylindrodendrum hubeiense]
MEAPGKREMLPPASTPFPVTLLRQQPNGRQPIAMDHQQNRPTKHGLRQGFLSRLRDDVNLSWADIPMLACSYLSGLIDSVAFNARSVFVSMQTGNTIFLALGAANLPSGAPLMWLSALVSLCAFWLGCYFFASTRHFHPRRKMTLSICFLIQAILIFIAALLGQMRIAPGFSYSLLESNSNQDGTEEQASERKGDGFGIDLVVVALLAFQSSGQIVLSRVLGFNEIPTNVVTSLYCDLLSDHNLFAPLGDNVKRNRRLTAVVLLLVGGISGGWLQRSSAVISLIWNPFASLSHENELTMRNSTKDMLVDPKTRGVTSIRHTVVAAASSSSKSRAEAFLQEVGATSSAAAYGSYHELVQDPNVEIIYVATPHSHHYQNVMLCLEAGKNVLCEKAFTVNAQQARKLAEKAKEKGCLLMEALWTRHFPLADYVRDTISSGKLGVISRVISDCSMGLSPETSFKDGKHRMVNADLAGGALLDMGIYALTWPFLALYDAQQTQQPKQPRVLAMMNKYQQTSADETTTMILAFPRDASAGGDAHAVATTSIRVGGFRSDPNPQASVRIQGDLGEIQLFPSAQNPKSTKIILKDGTVEERTWEKPGPGKGSGWYNGFGPYKNPEGEGQGMFWEADEAAFALIEGRNEGKHLKLDETIIMMEVMDEVRRQGGLAYSENIETTDYPVDL